MKGGSTCIAYLLCLSIEVCQLLATIRAVVPLPVPFSWELCHRSPACLTRLVRPHFCTIGVRVRILSRKRCRGDITIQVQAGGKVSNERMLSFINPIVRSPT